MTDFTYYNYNDAKNFEVIKLMPPYPSNFFRNYVSFNIFLAIYSSGLISYVTYVGQILILK